MHEYQQWQWDSHNRYRAKCGDAWDTIAAQAYGKPYLAPLLQHANPDLMHLVLLEGGEIIKIPIIDTRRAALTPPWRRGTA